MRRSSFPPFFVFSFYCAVAAWWLISFEVFSERVWKAVPWKLRKRGLWPFGKGEKPVAAFARGRKQFVASFSWRHRHGVDPRECRDRRRPVLRRGSIKGMPVGQFIPGWRCFLSKNTGNHRHPVGTKGESSSCATAVSLGKRISSVADALALLQKPPGI